MKERARSEQWRVRMAVREWSLQTMTDRSMESIFLSKSGVHHQGESVLVPKWGSTSKLEWREESVQAWSHDLQTSMGPSHRCPRVSPESMLVRHSRVKSAQSDSGSVHPDPSPSCCCYPFWFRFNCVFLVSAKKTVCFWFCTCSIYYIVLDRLYFRRG